MENKNTGKNGGHYIFRASMTLKDGTKIYAKNCGKRCFIIWVDDDEDREIYVEKKPKSKG